MTDPVKSIPSGHKASAKLLDAVTTVQTSGAHARKSTNSTYQASVSGTGSVSATIIIEFSNDGIYWIAGATITLSGTTSAIDGFAADAGWVYERANLTAISGTGAVVTVIAGE
jgi:hypothetical protein